MLRVTSHLYPIPVDYIDTYSYMYLQHKTYALQKVELHKVISSFKAHMKPAILSSLLPKYM